MEHLLFLSHRIPYPPDKGDKIRSWHILQHLAERYRVHLGCFRDDPADERHVDYLAGICASVCCRPLDPALGKLRSLAGFASGAPLTFGYFRDARLRQWVDETLAAHRPPVAFAFCSSMAPYLDRYRAGRRILDMVDIDSEKWRDYAATSSCPVSAVYRREQAALLRAERAMAASFDATFFASKAEAERFKRLAPETAERVSFLQNGVDLDFFDPRRAYPDPYSAITGPHILFTGAMDYRPNIMAVTWFAEAVLPLLRGRWPSLVFWIVGGNPTQAVCRLAKNPAVRVTGRVEDVRPYLAHATAAVAPMRIARGIQNKVLEAMAMAKPAIVTPEAAEGIDAAPGAEILIASTAEDFTARLSSVMTGGAGALGARAREHVEKDFRWDFTALDKLLGSPEPAARRVPVRASV